MTILNVQILSRIYSTGTVYLGTGTGTILLIFYYTIFFPVCRDRDKVGMRTVLEFLNNQLRLGTE
jgi:hypothetical protein